MILYYVGLAFRNLRNKPTFYGVNIAGLAIGLAACLMITHYVKYHRSFDRYQADSERIYRIHYSRWSEGGGDLVEFASATPIIGSGLKENIPEIEMQGQAFRLEGIFSHDDRHFEETRSFYAEPDLLTLLGVQIVAGEAISALSKPNTLAISESTANKYFGEANPIGKTMYYNYTALYEVVAVFADMPANTHFKADLFLSMETWKQQSPDLFQQGYIYSGFYNYIKLATGVDPETINAKAAQYVEQAYGDALAQGKINMGFNLMPLRDIHLKSHFMHELELNGDSASIGFLEIVAWFILVIAWVNFFNLSTISAIKRLREISIRKVNGATQAQLITQLLTESALINAMAILLALLVFESFAPMFFSFADLPNNIPVWNQPWVFSLLLIALIIGTFSAGIYSVTGIPDSRLPEMLKGASRGIRGKRHARKTLVTLQFFIAIGLIAATIIIFKQFRLISQTPLGFNIDNMLVVHAPLVSDSVSYNKLVNLKKELAGQAGIVGASFSSIIPGKPNMYNRGGVYLLGEDPTSGKNYRVTEVDESYFDVMGIKLIAGNGLTGNFASDRDKIFLNLNGVLWAGFPTPEEAIGKKMVLEYEEVTIAGVVDNFFQLSPKEAIEPQIFRAPRRFRGYITINAGMLSAEDAISKTLEVYEKAFPSNPFTFFFLDQFYQSQHLSERRFGMVFLLFSVLVILITILGLMGLSAYTAEQKRKEIGIRKVLGATSSNIFTLLFKEYLLLWFIGSIMAIPTVFLIIDRWLDSFALRAQPGVGFYLLPMLAVLAIALLTVFLQTYRVLNLNPALSIRTD